MAAPATALALLLAGAVLLTATEAGAQSTGELRVQIRNLTNQISSLRGQLADLERVVHGSGESQGTGVRRGCEEGTRFGTKQPASGGARGRH